MNVAIVLLALLGQDLWQKARPPAVPMHSSRTRERLDLSMGPLVDPSKCTIKPGSVGIDVKISPDFACGTFDVAAGFRSVFNKNLREELLGAILEQARAELASSAMVLACQISPTLCDAMKHYKILSSEALAMNFQQCRAVEAASAGLAEGLRARAIKQCLAEQQAKGVPLDEALKACQRADELRDAEGRKVKEIDVVREAGKALGLSGDSEGLLQQVAGGLKLGEASMTGRLRVRPVAEMFEQSRMQLEASWMEAMAEVLAGRAPALEKLTPPGAPPVTRAEVQRLAFLSEGERGVALRTLTSAFALQDVVRKIYEVVGALMAAFAGTPDPARKKELEEKSKELLDELRRLREEQEVWDYAAHMRMKVDALARGKIDGRAATAAGSWRSEAGRREEAQATAPWGGGCPVEKKK